MAFSVGRYASSALRRKTRVSLAPSSPRPPWISAEPNGLCITPTSTRPARFWVGCHRSEAVYTPRPMEPPAPPLYDAS